jgi:hypothetical protein
MPQRAVTVAEQPYSGGPSHADTVAGAARAVTPRRGRSRCSGRVGDTGSMSGWPSCSRPPWLSGPAKAATATPALRPEGGKRCRDRSSCGRFRGIPRPLAPEGTLGTAARHTNPRNSTWRFRPERSRSASATACVPPGCPPADAGAVSAPEALPRTWAPQPCLAALEGTAPNRGSIPGAVGLPRQGRVNLHAADPPVPGGPPRR